MGEPHPVIWRPKYNQKADPPSSRGDNFCLTALSYDIFSLVFVLELMGWPCYGKTWLNFCQPSTSLTFLVLSLHSQTGTKPSTFLGLQLTKWRFWDLSASIISCCYTVSKSCLTLCTHGLQHFRLPYLSLSHRVCWDARPLRLMAIETKMPSNHIILCCSLLLIPSASFSASGSFNELAFNE